jgi:hypothetical protein
MTTVTLAAPRAHPPFGRIVFNDRARHYEEQD